MTRRGYFSLLRWMSDPTRGEGRNVGLLLVEPETGFRAMRSAPISTLSSRLHDQGLLDSMLVELERKLDAEPRPSAEFLEDLHESLSRSLVVTQPKPVAVTDGDEALKALYRAYLAVRGGGSRAVTKGVLLDRVVAKLRSQGAVVARGSYIDDFIFDAVVEKHGAEPTVIEVLSFGTARKDWTPVEKDAGHFLYGLNELGLSDAAAFVQPPTREDEAASRSFGRVSGWLKKSDVRVGTIEQLEDTQLELMGIRRSSPK